MTDFWFVLYEPSSQALPQLLSHTVQIWYLTKAVEEPGNKVISVPNVMGASMYAVSESVYT